jgi:outer membrane protein
MKSLLLFLLFSPFARGEEVSSRNIRSLLEAKNPKVQASILSVEASEKREGGLVRSFLPSIELYGAYENFKKGIGSRKTQPAYGARAELNLFNGGKDWLEARSVDLETEKRKFGNRKMLAEELEEVRGLYWRALYLRDKITLLEATLKVNEGSLESARRRIRGGVATDSDRFEFEMNAVDIRREIALAKAELDNQKRRLALELGLAEVNLTEVLGHEHDFDHELEHSAADHEFLYKEQEIQAKQLASASTVRAREWWPKLSAFAEYNQFNQREEENFARAEDRRESVVGLKVSVLFPVGAGFAFESSALEKEARAAEMLAAYGHEEAEVVLHGEMATLKLMHDQVHEAEENIKRAETYYRMTQSEYARGVKNSPDVLGASEKLYDMQHKRLEIIRDFQVAKAHVLSKIGK